MKNKIKYSPKYEFTIKSDKIVVSDPCYDRTVWCANFGVPALNGEWLGFVSFKGNCGMLVSSLTAHHHLHKFDLKESKQLPIEVGVDSGQVGIFDDDYYPKDKTGEKHASNNIFYSKCCNLTDQDFGIIDDFGIVSRTGHGDGGYTGLVNYVNNKVVAVKIKFF